MKTSRQAKLLELIQNRAIDTQTELSDLLRENGFVATQATISRDMRELMITKVPTQDGRYRYEQPAEVVDGDHGERLRNIFRESITSVQSAQNIVVMKTLPALASAACAALDTMTELNIVGTLAGDDTAFLVLPDEKAAQACRDLINGML